MASKADYRAETTLLARDSDQETIRTLVEESGAVLVLVDELEESVASTRPRAEIGRDMKRLLASVWLRDFVLGEGELACIPANSQCPLHFATWLGSLHSRPDFPTEQLPIALRIVDVTDGRLGAVQALLLKAVFGRGNE